MRRVMSQRTLIGPVTFSLVGGSVGLCWAMLYLADPNERVHVYLDDSALPVVVGVFLGLLIGWIVSAVIRSRPLLARCAAVLAATLLCAAMGGPIGWIVGDGLQKRSPTEGMNWGAVVGALVGLILGVVHWFRYRRRSPNWEEQLDK
jgi:hypothetical protein